MRFVEACVIASMVTLCIVPATKADPATPTPSVPADAQPDVATLLFGTPQWSKAPPGSSITYSYAKKTSDAALGAPFDDTIVETLEKGGSSEPDRRSIDVRMFSGMNAKPAGPFDATAQNPVLLLVLEENVQELSKAFKGNVRYLKNAIRKAWRDNAKIDKVDVMVAGKPVPGTRIVITPFVDDPEKDKMLGLEGMAYVVELADSVPGQIAKIDIRAPATGTAKFSETLTYASEKAP